MAVKLFILKEPRKEHTMTLFALVINLMSFSRVFLLLLLLFLDTQHQQPQSFTILGMHVAEVSSFFFLMMEI